MTAKRALVLVIDDKPNMLRLMDKVLRPHALVRTAASGGEALRVLASQPVDVVLCDLRMPDMDGLEVLRASKRLRPSAEFILMTAYATIGTAIEAMRLGAYDYLTKPFEPDAARAVVLRALGRVDATDATPPVEVLPGLVGRSLAMQELADLVQRVAKSDATALILGETGTGKELVARALHQLSRRAAHRFIAVNCAAIPAELLESEVFGYARGSFTGASRDRPGLFEEAHRGTLFLDEVAEMRLSLQAKLTRALEEKAIRRIGEAAERPVDVRLIAATHQDLQGMVQQHAFREDLWYRLNVAVLRVPPLRERRDDIELLATRFLRGQGTSTWGQQVRRFTAEAMTALVAYDWPGNVRQLRAAIERACIVARGEHIDVSDLPPEIASQPTAASDASDLADLTWAEALERGRSATAKQYLEAVLRKSRGHVSEAAAHAGIERESFYRLMRRFGVPVEGQTGEESTPDAGETDLRKESSS